MFWGMRSSIKVPAQCSLAPTPSRTDCTSAGQPPCTCLVASWAPPPRPHHALHAGAFGGQLVVLPHLRWGAGCQAAVLPSIHLRFPLCASLCVPMLPCSTCLTHHERRHCTAPCVCRPTRAFFGSMWLPWPSDSVCWASPARWNVPGWFLV